MIEKMLLLSFVYQPAGEEKLFLELQAKGLVHFNYDPMQRSARVLQLDHYAEVLEHYIQDVSNESLEGYQRPTNIREDHQYLEDLKQIKAEITKLEQEKEHLLYEQERIQHFGDFSPEDIQTLQDAGLSVHLYKVGQNHIQELEGLDWFLLYEQKKFYYIAIISKKENLDLPFKQLSIPKEDQTQINGHIQRVESRLGLLKQRLTWILAEPAPLLHLYWELKNLVHFEQVKDISKKLQQLSSVSGYCAASDLEAVKEVATVNHAVLLSEEPIDRGKVPTKFKHNGWSRLFVPILKFIGVVPGYNEKDINGFFMFFFSIFFAMLIGDAGYGALLILITGFLQLKKKHWPRQIFTLFYFLSLCTLGWGAVTGMWFGYEAFASTGPLSHLVVQSLNSFAKESGPVVMRLCFLLGFSQLAFAHLWQVLIQPLWTRKVSEFGWIGLLWGFYLLAEFFLLKTPLPSYTKTLFAASMGILILFSEQGPTHFLKGVLRGLIHFPMNLLDAVGFFSDVISYIRLFALGLATKEMAHAANTLAFQTGWETTTGLLLGILVLLLGHTINLTLAAIAVMVHGIRLNFLEFAKHLQMEWTGKEFDPLRFQQQKHL